jgi:hypothetical protein
MTTRVTIVLALAIAGSAWAQERGDAAARTKATVEKTRSQRSYSVKFLATISVPDSTPMELDGETLWVTGGVLFTQYKAPGGEVVQLMRLGEKVWIYDELIPDWIPAEQVGKPGAGRGIQNPDEVLQTILKATDQAVAAGKDAGGDIFEIKLEGPQLQKVLRQQAADGTMDLAASAGTVKLVVNPADGLMYRLEVSAQVASTDPNLKGKKVGYSANVSLKSYNKDFTFEFTQTDRATKKTVALPWSAEFMADAEKAAGLPDELKAEIKKRTKK